MILTSTDNKISVKGFNSLEEALNYYERAEVDLPEYKHQIPQFPEWLNKDLKRKVEVVNLYMFKCTCDEFSEREKYFEERDIRKVCSHIFYAIQRFAVKYLDELTDKLLSEQKKYGIQKLYKLNNNMLIGAQLDNDWIKIYLLSDNKWRSYSYNIKEKRFSYNLIPPIEVKEITALYEKQ